ncbi:MAG: glycoside hydrolase family 32 protein [Micropruina sp.]|uniref:glycoside hydrolase family 32 protein n=1 Tax=Micropruina sp. TaxID=2737536 RepID=UPI0039E3FDB0
MTSDDLIDEALAAIAASRSQLDPDYPRFHLAPPVGRLNDPNGLVIVDGVYHAFYQFGPFFPGRKQIYWGHASSSDLVTWRSHAPAIAPSDWYDRSGAYSGGATIHDGRLWLHYTGNVKSGGRRESYQCAAISDDLVRFAKHPANPLISGSPPGYTAHLRDPQVLVDDQGFRMLLGAQRADETGCILSYRSADLVRWDFEGELSFPGSAGRYDAFGYMWECPNLLRVPDEDTGELRDVLIFCPQGLAPAGDSFRNIFPCGYLVGRLDGTAFHVQGEFRELDRGFEFYAPQAFRRPDDADAAAPVLLGWLGNASEDNQPSLADHGWVHTMTFPRRLTLRDGVLLQRPPAEAVAAIGPGRELALSGTALADASSTLPELAGADAFALTLELDQSDAEEWGLTIATRPGSELLLGFRRGRLTVDRSATRYPHGERRSLAIPDSTRIRIELIHDRSITELFVADGQTAFSLRSYLDAGERQVALQASGTLRVLSGHAVVPAQD